MTAAGGDQGSGLARPADDAVVITGIGLVTPFGSDPNVIVPAVAAGQSATRWLNDPPRVRERAPGLFAGAPARFDSSSAEDPVVEMAELSAVQAVAHSGLDLSLCDRDRVGCVVGTSKGQLVAYRQAFATGAPQAGYPGFCPNSPALRVAARFGLGGACLCPVTACATGLQSVARGADLITSNACDVVLAGSSDASICDWVLSSFNRLGVLAKQFSDPATAVRPFDENRDGFLVGEGAAILVLERKRSAMARGAPVIAEWLAAGSAADTTGMTQIDESGDPLAELIRRTLVRGGVSPDEVDYVNLHGTATVPNDLAEVGAMRSVFDTLPPASSLKGSIGHLLGAAGSVELAVTLLALRTGVVPTTANTERSILDSATRPATAPATVLKTSLGFGGHLQAAVLRVFGP